MNTYFNFNLWGFNNNEKEKSILCDFNACVWERLLEENETEQSTLPCGAAE